MLRRGDIGSYLYWSDRRINEIASDNAIHLERQSRWVFKGSLLGIGGEIGSKEPKQQTRREQAAAIEKAIGDHAIETFDSPPIALFAKGVSRIHMARFIGGPTKEKGLLFHIRSHSAQGQQIDLILFGSMDNIPGRFFRPSDGPEAGWYSSAWSAIAELLESHGSKNTSQWDDPESLSVEALKIALNQGAAGTDVDHEGRPWTRGYTLGHADHAKWFAQIYTDVVLSVERWDFRGSPLKGAQRILIGAPAWVRTADPPSVIRYSELRAGSLARRRGFIRSQRRQTAAIPKERSALLELEAS